MSVLVSGLRCQVGRVGQVCGWRMCVVAAEVKTAGPLRVMAHKNGFNTVGPFL